MEGYSSKHDSCPKLLDLIPNESEWITKRSEEKPQIIISDDKKLELCLGPPGGGNYNLKESKNTSFTYFANNPCVQNTGAVKSPWQHYLQQNHAVKNEGSQPCSPRDFLCAEKKTLCPAKLGVTNSSTAQKRTAPAPAPVVGWPPIRSFRKNLTSGGTSTKLAVDSPNDDKTKIHGQKSTENCPKSLFVKINMDGVPIGRKVDLKLFDSYEKLSYAVDELFRGLLEAQSDHFCAGGMKDKESGHKSIGGLLNGDGEYTLVYEDNEGDRMLVGDVPWHMFVSTVKRLRVLKSSELLKLSRGSKQDKLSVDATMK